MVLSIRLTLGVVDEFKAAGLRVFGPQKEAARLEGSKAFAKEIMNKAGVPTAEYKECGSKVEALEYLKDKTAPIVLKADGLAAGKGVHVCLEDTQIDEAVEALYGSDENAKVVIEDYLSGVEASFICACSEDTIVPLASSHDYKRIGDNDAGPNTGGMGAVSPTPNVTRDQEAWAVEHVIRPVVEQLAKEGAPFSGFLYAGLMITEGGTIDVLEFNVRLGDPETQAILMRMDSDLFELLFALAGNEDVSKASWSDDAAVCLVLASKGYPAAPQTGDIISGLEHFVDKPYVNVFHAGTKRDEDGIKTSGGRVLNVVALGDDVAQARERAYEAAKMIHFEGRQMRSDIAS